MNANSEITEEIEDEDKKEAQILEENEDTVTKIQALEMVDIAYDIVEEADKQTEECKLLLDSNLLAYTSARISLKKTSFDSCEDLLSRLGSEIKYDSQFNKDMFVFEAKTNLEYIELQEISTGQFSGVALALFGAMITASSLVYIAIQNLSLNTEKQLLPSMELIEKLMPWFATLIGQKEDMLIGSSIVGSSVLIVMGIIYFVRIQLKEKSNFIFAQKQLIEAENYVVQKGNCKIEMDRVDTHIKNAITTLKLYEVILNEQKAKLQRILHIEGIKTEHESYHDKSLLEMGYTKELMRSIKDFISLPMSEKGLLSQKSITLLENAKQQVNKMIKRLYERK